MQDTKQVFFLRQEVRILRHLRFYAEARRLGIKPPEYWKLKDEHVIPSLHEALRLMREGAYGTCVCCADEIERGRLEVIPGALRCTECQKKHETRIRIRAS